MSRQYEKLKVLLKELFQFDLDFGLGNGKKIYRSPLSERIVSRCRHRLAALSLTVHKE